MSVPVACSPANNHTKTSVNILSIDPVGAGLPFALTLLYARRTLGVLDPAMGICFVLALPFTRVLSHCDAQAVHVFPGTVLLGLVVWLARLWPRQLWPHTRWNVSDVPAGAIFALSFAAAFPTDLYLGFSCHSVTGTARVGGGAFADGLLLCPAFLGAIHLFVYGLREAEDRGKIDWPAFLRQHFCLADPRRL